MNPIPPVAAAPPARRVPVGRVLRWLAVGVGTMLVNLTLLAALVDLARWPVPGATLAVAATGMVLRFLANDRLVFGHRRPTWARFAAYAIATGGSSCAGYVLVNTLVWLGVYYLLAALVVAACSVTLNLATNFLWVWRSRKTEDRLPPAA